MDRCFWEERLSKISIYKNDELLTGLHLEAPYGFFWRHTNNMTGTIRPLRW
jgi:hypothetical protein